MRWRTARAPTTSSPTWCAPATAPSSVSTTSISSPPPTWRRSFPDRARADGRYYAVDFTLEEVRRLRVHERLDRRFPHGASRFAVPTFEEMIELVAGLNRTTGRSAGDLSRAQATGLPSRARVSRWRRRSSPSRAATAWADPTRRRSSSSASSPGRCASCADSVATLPQIFLLDDDAAPLLTDAWARRDPSVRRRHRPVQAADRARSDAGRPRARARPRRPHLDLPRRRRRLGVRDLRGRAAGLLREVRCRRPLHRFPGPGAELARLAQSKAPLMAARLSVLVPTRNEADNVAPLVERLERCLLDTGCEVVFVDDSDDDTPARVRRVAESAAVAVVLIARPPGERDGGLGGAVIEGARAASGEWLCVMDGDLQHPPELVPVLLARAEETGADLVLASRLAPGGSVGTLSRSRAALSRTLAWTTTRLFAEPLARRHRPDDRVLRRAPAGAATRAPPSRWLQDPARDPGAHSRSSRGGDPVPVRVPPRRPQQGGAARDGPVGPHADAPGQRLLRSVAP